MTMAAAASPRPASKNTMSPATSFALHSSFFLTGIVTAILGPLIPALRVHFGVDTAQAGSLFVVQFVGGSLGSLYSQRRIRTSILGGLALIGVGLAALPLAMWIFAHLAVFGFGVGLGLVIPATNMYVAHARSETRAASLNVLNLFWGAGAVTSPVIVAFLSIRLGMSGTLFVVAGCAAAVCIVSAIIPMRVPAPAEDCAASGDRRSVGPLLVFCLMLFLYVGIETSVGGWTATYLGTITSASFWMTWSVAGFWGALLAGRALAPFVLRRMTERTLLWTSLTLAASGIAGLILTRAAAGAFISAVVIGFGLAPLFALILTLISNFASAGQIAVPGWLFSCSSTGGAALPWAVGFITARTGSIRNGLLVPALAIVALMAMARSMAYPARDER